MRTRTGSITTWTAEREDVASTATGRRVVQTGSTKWNRVSRRKSGAASEWQVSRLLARDSRDRGVVRPEDGERDRDKRMGMKEQCAESSVVARRGQRAVMQTARYGAMSSRVLSCRSVPPVRWSERERRRGGLQ
jgi:hypothetical protein